MRPRYISTARGSWEIGLIFSQTGRLSNIGTSQLEGAILAIDEINAAGGIDGVPVRPIIRDDGSDLHRFLHHVDVMLRGEGANIILGGSSPEARRIATPVVERRNGLMFYSGYNDGFDYSQNIVCMGLSPNQVCGTLFRGNGLSATSDIVIFYREDLLSNGIKDCLIRELHRVGAPYVREVRIADDPKEAQTTIARAGLSADTKIVLVAPASDAVAFASALRAAGQRQEVTTFGLSEKDLLFAGGLEGVLTVSTYCGTVISPAAESFNVRFARRYGRNAYPDGHTEATYCALCILALSIERTNSLDTDEVQAAVAETSLRGPQGLVAIDPETNCARLWPRILRWTSANRFEVVSDASIAIPADPFLVRHSEMNLV